jgi:AsmA protein
LATRLLELALYGGAGTGSLGIDASGKVPAITLSVALAHVRIEPLLAAAADMDRLSGTGTFNLAVTARGASQRALIGSLDGKGDLALADGAVKGVNLLALAQAAVPGVVRSEMGDLTSFGSLRASFTIKDGVLDNRDLLLKTRLAPITGAGTVNLPQRSLDYRAVADLAGAVQVPIRIGGTFEHPTYRPELAAPAQQLKGLLDGKGTPVPNPGNLLRRLLPR